MLLKDNSAPYNFFNIFSDGFVAIWLLGLLPSITARAGSRWSGRR